MACRNTSSEIQAFAAKRHLLTRQLPEFHTFEFLDGNTFLVWIGENKGFIYIFQIILHLIIGGADDYLESQIPDQFDAARYFFSVHFGKCLVQNNQAYGGIALELGRQVETVSLGKTCKKGYIEGILSLSAGIFL